MGATTDRDTHKLVSKFNVKVLVEASLVLHYIWEDDPAKCSSLADCYSVLTQDEELYKVLKDAHANGVYEKVRRWESRIPLPLSSSQDTLAVNAGPDVDVDIFLTGLQSTMRRLVVGDIFPPTWSPSSAYHEPEIVAHLNSLKIPLLNERPNLLLHNLGSFTHDALLARRLRNIFMPNNHTFLVNTSGSGKTRLLLEGLCENWGFYFTSLLDSSHLGSKDIANSIRIHVPDSSNFRRVLPRATSPAHKPALETNRAIASRIFRQAFLARLMIFNLFAETMNNYIKAKTDIEYVDPQVYKERWLLLQLQPSFFYSQDVFDELSRKLSGASDSFINTKTETLLSTIRSKLSSVVQSGDPTAPLQPSIAETTQIPLFCVLDEAQHAATQLNDSFRSQDGSHRPILREIVKTWLGQSIGQGVFMVVAGTGISKDSVDKVMNSAIMKDVQYRWCSDTGAFDLQDVQLRYLQKYLPQSFLETEVGVRLLERVWYWLHGRHRFTAGYVTELLVHGFKRPHGLLKEYVKQFADFNITDASEFVEAEGSDTLSLQPQGKLDFSKLLKNTDMLTTIHELTAHHLMRSIDPRPLGKDEATYVEYGFARFVDGETRTAAIDEPLVLLAATKWINGKHQTSYKIFANQIKNRDGDRNGFENYIAFCIDLIFSSRPRLKDVFSFQGNAPTWCNLEAELVSFQRTTSDQFEISPVRHFDSFGPSFNLGINAPSRGETLKWLERRSHSPICFPDQSMGPDLIFVLKLSDGSLIWVALQAKYCSESWQLPREKLRDAVRSVTPCKFFLNKDDRVSSPASHPDLVDQTSRYLKELPHRRVADAGTYSLLRVVASFPAETNLKRCSEEDPDGDEGHPIASLKMSLVKKVTRELSPTDFLQNIERKHKKRKRAPENTTTNHRTTKRIKPN